MNTLDHIGIAVFSLEKAIPSYQTLGFVLDRVEEVVSEGVKVAFLSAGQTHVELLEPLNEQSPVAKFLKTKGEGVHHLAFGVKNLKEYTTQLPLSVHVIEPKIRLGAGGCHVAFIHPKSTHGVLIEGVEISS